jgi:predicted transcriptional regulator
MISKVGMTMREIAEKKGVTPETLSRHIHGKI